MPGCISVSQHCGKPAVICRPGSSGRKRNVHRYPVRPAGSASAQPKATAVQQRAKHPQLQEAAGHYLQPFLLFFFLLLLVRRAEVRICITATDDGTTTQSWSPVQSGHKSPAVAVPAPGFIAAPAPASQAATVRQKGNCPPAGACQ